MIMNLGSIPNGESLIEKNGWDGCGLHLSKQRKGVGVCRVCVAKGCPVFTFSSLKPLQPPALKGNVGKISLRELRDKST